MNELVIFTHVPKVAGTSLYHQLIAPNYEPSRIKQFKGARDLLGTPRGSYDILVQHSIYGVHHLTRRRCAYFTMLRDPVKRSLSHYFFLRHLNHISFNRQQKLVHTTTPIEEIFERNALRRYRPSSWLIDNMQTRYIAGLPWFYLPGSSSRLLARAKKNLRERYVVFGLQEQFDDSVSRIQAAFGWSRHPDQRRHKASNPDEQPTEAQLEAVRRNNLLDLELYDYAADLFRAG